MAPDALLTELALLAGQGDVLAAVLEHGPLRSALTQSLFAVLIYSGPIADAELKVADGLRLVLDILGRCVVPGPQVDVDLNTAAGLDSGDMHENDIFVAYLHDFGSELYV